MAIVINIIVGIALLATALILIAGLVSMGFKDVFSEKFSNLLMRYRVIAQGIAVALMAVAAILLNI
jgi:biopolymer transport protein ExbB/TolQ